MRRKILAAFAAIAVVLGGVFVTTSVANAAGVCTNPQFVFEGQGGNGMGRYFADAGMWATGGHDYRQQMGVCDVDSWYVDVSVPNHQDRAVLAYPNVHYDWVTDWSTRPLTGMRSLDSFSSLTSDFAHQAPPQGDGIWNVAFDIWLNGVGNGDGTTELMVWTENSGQRPAGTLRGTVNVDGKAWELWTTRETPSESSFQIVTYKAVNTVTSGNLDVLAFTDHLTQTGRIKQGSVIGQLDYGVEIVQTGATPDEPRFLHFDFTNFRVNQDTAPTPDPTTTEPSPDPTTSEPTPDPTTSEPTPDPTDPPVEVPTVEAGTVEVKPIPDRPTRVHVDLPPGAFDSPPVITTSPVVSKPGSRVVETSVKHVTADGFDLYLYRVNAYPTRVNWIAVE